MHKDKSILLMLPLFLILFIDGMGLGLLFPILNSIIIEPNAGFLDPNITVGARDFYYGFTIGIFMICWFIGATILGDLSDGIGRKKALMICLIGSFGGYFIAAIAILIKSFWLLIVGRMVAGFTAGSQPIAQAAIVDVSTVEHKARNIGLILLAVSLGFVFGPLLGGLLSNSNVVSWFDFTMPMYFAAAISLFNAILLQLTFKETFKKAHDGVKRIRILRAFELFKSAFTHKAIEKYSLVLLIMIFGWSNYFTFISLYLTQVYHYSIIENSLFLAVMGLGFSLGCGYLVDYCSKRFDLNKTVFITLILTAVEIAITLISSSIVVAWVMVFFIGTTLSVAYSTLLAIFSNLVDENEQGWVMGVTGSIMAICFGLTALFTGLIAQMGAVLPMLLAVIGLSLSALLLRLLCMKKQ